jgi:glyoxylase-like metal-dependent hydrolase (beta-lactamase superfamily II)
MEPADPKTSRLVDRRLLLKLSMAGGLAAVVSPPGVAQAQDAQPLLAARPMPIVDTRFPAEMAPGVFVLPDKRIPLVPNIGIIVGREKVLVVDCGMGVENAEKVMRLAGQLAPGRQIVLTVTHAHPEHGFGAQVFKPDGRIYYNATQRDYLQRSGATLLDGFRTGVLPPTQKHLLDGVVLTPPDETYDGAQAVLDLGGRMVEFRTWGTAHTPGDQIIYLPQEGIVFAGDLLEERMFPIVPLFPPMITSGDIDVARWEIVLNDIRRLEPRLIVPGHGNLGGVEIAEDVLAYFSAMRSLVRAGGRSVSDLQSEIRAKYPTWENSEFISPALQYFQQGA